MSRVTHTRADCELLKIITYSPVEQYRFPIYGEIFGQIVKPDVVRNEPASDGYRIPSDYHVTTMGIPMAIPAGGEYFDPIYRIRTNWEGDVAGGLWLNHVILPADLATRYQDQLRTKVLNNLKDEILDVAVLIAELQGTTDVLVKGLERIARSMDSLLTRKPKSFKYLMHGQKPSNLKGKKLDSFNREVAGDYLEWKYGIMPTVMDVQGACKALDINEEGSLFNNPALLVARAVLKGSEMSTSHIHLARPCWKRIDAPVEVKWSGSARIDYSINMEGIRGLNRYGLGLGTVSTVLLERTPFSFVLNMAFPIMDLVKAWTALGGVNVRGYSETFYLEPNLKAMSWYDRGGNAGLRLDVPEAKLAPSFIRKAGTSVPMPLPFIRNPIKTGNLATVLALFTQLRSK